MVITKRTRVGVAVDHIVVDMTIAGDSATAEVFFQTVTSPNVPHHRPGDEQQDDQHFLVLLDF
jgi:hypothetical protein